MAYLKSLVNPCRNHPICTRRAVVELIDRWNGSRGAYCRPCGKKALAVQKLNEAPMAVCTSDKATP